mgnify:CR=1 FL=1
MITTSGTEVVKRGRGRPVGSKTRKIKEKINFVNLPLLDQENNRALPPHPRAIKSMWRVADQRIGQAHRVLEQHPRMPAPWKRNILAFLRKLMGQCPYQANWFWAIECIKRDLKKKVPKIIAPFAYFRECLLNPNKFKMQTARETHWQIADWLLKTKGAAASWNYRHRHADLNLVSPAQVAAYVRRKALLEAPPDAAEVARSYQLMVEMLPTFGTFEAVEAYLQQESTLEGRIELYKKKKQAAKEFRKQWEVEKQARRLMKLESDWVETPKGWNPPEGRLEE